MTIGGADFVDLVTRKLGLHHPGIFVLHHSPHGSVLPVLAIVSAIDNINATSASVSSLFLALNHHIREA